jgi:hypothetical protein
MSDKAKTAEKAIKRLSCRDPTLKRIRLYRKQHTDADIAELADSLLAHPDLVIHVYLGFNRLTDETGVKLAQYVAASSTIESLSLINNQLGPATYLALAAALQVNTSLQCLDLYGNQAEDKSHIDAAFFDALRLNPSRPTYSLWFLYSFWNDFPRLQNEAKELGHPSLQLLLCAQLDHFTFQIKKH